jgi:hypothetical protein
MIDFLNRQSMKTAQNRDFQPYYQACGEQIRQYIVQLPEHILLLQKNKGRPSKSRSLFFLRQTDCYGGSFSGLAGEGQRAFVQLDEPGRVGKAHAAFSPGGLG